MSIGDFLELFAAAAFIAAAALWGGLVLALVVTGACLAYLAQVWADTSVSVKPDK